MEGLELEEVGLACEVVYEEVVHEGCGLLEQIDLLLIVRELALLEEVAVLCASNPNHATAVCLFPTLATAVCLFPTLATVACLSSKSRHCCVPLARARHRCLHFIQITPLLCTSSPHSRHCCVLLLDSHHCLLECC